jgi:hypothetical protein
MAPQVPGLFYATKLQPSLAWWKHPLNFASKKVVRYIEHGVKVEFKKGLPFAPKPSAPKFVDPQDVDFAIQDLLKGRRIGAYQDLAEGGEQFLSRSRVHTPPGKGKQRIVHALCSLNETTVKRQTTYEDLRMLKSVVKPQDFMLSLDVESAYFHVPSIRSTASSSPATWRCRSLSTTSSSSCSQEVTMSAPDQTSRHWCLRPKRRRTCATFTIKSSSSLMRPCRSVGPARPEYGQVSCQSSPQRFAATACAPCSMSTTS